MKKYTFDQVVKASEEYFNDRTSAEVFANKYALRNKQGEYTELTPDDMHRRLAKEFARIETKFKTNAMTEEEIYGLFKNFKYVVPQGSPMAAIGNTHSLMSASNCTVVASPEDDLSSIMHIGSEMAQLFKRRCGVGVDLSKLRPLNSKVNNAANYSSGAYSFADYYSYVTRMIGQLGRNGALMVTMDILHPDSALFATVKHDKTKVTGANLSLRLNNEFMKAVEGQEKVTLRWPLEGKPQIEREIDASALFDVIVNSAHKTGDPGLLMWDTYLNNLPAQSYSEFKSVSTNPCSEIVLSPYDSCRLISINMSSYVQNPFKDDAKFDFELYEKHVGMAQRLSDDLVELELELVERIRDQASNDLEKQLWHKIYEAAYKGRRTGLGNHGVGDTLAKLRLKYDSPEAHTTIDRIMETFRNSAYSTSVKLAEERGAFPVWSWETEKKCEFFKRMPSALINKMKESGRRNVSLLTNAPTGTTSMMSKTTSGIEPIFRLEYMRRVKIHNNNLSVDFVDEVGDKWHHYNIVHHSFKEYCEANEIVLNPKKTLKEQNIQIPEYFTASDKLNYGQNVKLIGIIQKYVDHGVSCTINLPKESTPDVVKKVYLDAWKAGLKGVTVYVDGSKSGVLVDDAGTKTNVTNYKKRPKDIPCDIHITTCQGKRWVVVVGLMNNRPYEVFAGKASDLPMPRDITKAVTRKIGRRKYSIVYEESGEEVFVPIQESFIETNGMLMRLLINQCLRHGVPIQALHDTVNKATDITDFSRTVLRVLKTYSDAESNYKSKCFNCGSTNMRPVDGCMTCEDCSSSKCS